MPDYQIGYYVHHHGAGHLMRAMAIAEHVQCPVTLIGSSVPDEAPDSNIRTLRLPMDTASGVRADSFDTLHYAPLGVDGLRERMALLAEWFRRAWPCVLVVDVSVEIATFARLFGVPTIYVRQHGRRDDPPHQQAYAMASRLLAPYPAAMESRDTPLALLEKTDHAGWVSRYTPTKRDIGQPGSVLVINGRGGTAFSHQAMEQMARACPQWRFRIAGEVRGTQPAQLSPNVEYLGQLTDPLEEMVRAEIIIGSAGDSLVSESASVGRRYIAVAEDRPYDEQLLQARRLNELGVAIGLDRWADAGEWPALLGRARQLPVDRWQAMADSCAPVRAARMIEAAAEQAFAHH
jgi:hypothetical protein